MKKMFRSYFIFWLILCAAFNAVCFFTPNETETMTKFGGAFWAGYAGIMVAFVGQLICALWAFRADTADKFFLRIPTIRISYSALILTLIVGSVCMIVPDLPNWIGALICLVILFFKAIAIWKASTAATLVEKREQQVKSWTLFVKVLTADAQNLMNAAPAELKPVCRKVYEAVRYSDPVSDIALTEIEEKITAAFEVFSQSVSAFDAQGAETSGSELLKLISERNFKCRMLK